MARDFNCVDRECLGVRGSSGGIDVATGTANVQPSPTVDKEDGPHNGTWKRGCLQGGAHALELAPTPKINATCGVAGPDFQ